MKSGNNKLHSFFCWHQVFVCSCAFFLARSLHFICKIPASHNVIIDQQNPSSSATITSPSAGQLKSTHDHWVTRIAKIPEISDSHNFRNSHNDSAVLPAIFAMRNHMRIAADGARISAPPKNQSPRRPWSRLARELGALCLNLARHQSPPSRVS